MCRHNKGETVISAFFWLSYTSVGMTEHDVTALRERPGPVLKRGQRKENKLTGKKKKNVGKEGAQHQVKSKWLQESEQENGFESSSFIPYVLWVYRVGYPRRRHTQDDLISDMRRSGQTKHTQQMFGEQRREQTWLRLLRITLQINAGGTVVRLHLNWPFYKEGSFNCFRFDSLSLTAMNIQDENVKGSVL